MDSQQIKTSMSIRSAAIPAPSMLTFLKAALKCVEGSTLDIDVRNPGIISAGQKVPPRKTITKNVIMEIGCILSVLRAKLAIRNPKLRKHTMPKVKIIQKRP